MVGLLKRVYGLFHAVLIGALRRVPVSSRVFGPPKGIIRDMKSWFRKRNARYPDETERCWYKTFREQTVIQQRYPAQSLFPAYELPELIREQPEAFTASIADARVIMNSGIVISPDDQVFQQSCSWGLKFFPSDIEYNTLRPLLRPASKLDGVYMAISSRMWTNYYHWLSECLTRLCVAEDLPEVPILLPNGLTDWHRQTLEMLGVGSQRYFFLDEGCHEVEQLLFPSFPGITGHMADWSFRALRQKFCGEHRKRQSGKRIYIGRGDVRHRRVSNEDEILRALEREGFTMLEGHRMKTTEVRDFLSDAEIVIGVHGAGMTNIIFVPEETPVIEVFDPAHIVNSYYLMAASLGHRYWYLYGENETARRGMPIQKGYDDISVSVEQLLRTLDAATATDVGVAYSSRS